jgi:hypothetical protein
MKPYSVEIDVTTRYTIEIHANNEEKAQEIAENMDLDEIESDANFKDLRSAEVTNVEEITDDN